jgi:dihydroxyacid dehydratase/phosphogluconate dehydratase
MRRFEKTDDGVVALIQDGDGIKITIEEPSRSVEVDMTDEQWRELQDNVDTNLEHISDTLNAEIMDTDR